MTFRHARMAATSLPLLLASCSALFSQVTPSAVSATPTSLTFVYQPGTTLPSAQTVSVRAATGTPSYTVAITGMNTLWLTATPDSGRLTATLSVRANPTSLAAGVYTANVVVTVAGVVTPITLPVTLTVTNPAPILSLSATTLAFASPPAVPVAQSIKLATSGSPLSFSATVNAAPWLTVTPPSGVLLPGAQSTLNFAVDASNLAPQAAPYTGRVTIAAPGASGASKSQVITVTLIVNSLTPTITNVWPTAISLNSPATTITIRGAGFYNATVAYVSGVAAPLTTTVLGSDALLAVVPASLLNTAATLNIVVTNPAPGGNSTPSPITVGNVATISAIVNSATLQVGSVSLGELITVFGANLGPATPAIMADADVNGIVDTTLANVTATVDGQPAPLLYVSPGQVTLQVPYEATAGANKAVSITLGTATPATANVTITSSAPGLFTIDGSGQGQAAVLNYNATTMQYSVNSTTNQARIGDTILLYATGEGDYATTLTPRTGLLVPSTLSPIPQLSPLPVVTIGGTAATVSYAGPSIGSIMGLLQINVVVPTGVTVGNAVPVTIGIGANTSPAGVTIALH